MAVSALSSEPVWACTGEAETAPSIAAQIDDISIRFALWTSGMAIRLQLGISGRYDGVESRGNYETLALKTDGLVYHSNEHALEVIVCKLSAQTERDDTFVTITFIPIL